MLIGYRDVLVGSNFAAVEGVFSSGAPLSNALDRRLAVVATFATNIITPTELQATFASPGKTIGLAAILAHDFPSTFSIRVRLGTGTDLGGGIVYDETLVPWVPPADSQFPRHLFVVFPQNYEGIRIVSFQIVVDADGLNKSFGRIWAGPVWQTSEDSVSREDFDPRIVDPGTINKSLGGQNYADVRQKYRQHTMRLPWLSEAEAIGTEDGTTQNLQDISFEVGKTDPIIAIPSLDNNQVIHKLGMYGTFAEPPSPRLIPESAERHYESTFDVIEEL